MTLWIEPKWPAPQGIRVLSTWRGDPQDAKTDAGASRVPYESFNLADHVGDEKGAVAENRRILRIEARLPSEPVWLSQVHGTTVADLDATSAPGPADAAITRQVGKVCVILSADCLPVVFATQAGDAVAAAHAGWRGLAAGVIGATVRAFRAPPEDLLAWFGPGIGPDHFEVGAEVRESMLAADPGAGEAFKLGARGRYMADLPLLVRRQLQNLGVARIFGDGECTYAHPDRYFSHRRDGVTGRQATLIWREARQNG